jgi:hypothetical protein
MRLPEALGAAAGLLGATVSVVSNLRRGDPHLVSVAPDLLSLAVMSCLVWLAVARVGAQDRANTPVACRRATLAAGIVFGVAGGFTWWYLPSHPFVLGSVSALVGFSFIYLVGLVAARPFTMHGAES